MINFNFPIIGGKYIERKRKQWIAIGYAEGLEIGRAERRAHELAMSEIKPFSEKRTPMTAKLDAWRKRRFEAKRDGMPFDEPPPDASA